jgi:hypothetical protein
MDKNIQKHMHSHDTTIFDDNGPMNIITKIERKKGGTKY